MMEGDTAAAGLDGVEVGGEEEVEGEVVVEEDEEEVVVVAAEVGSVTGEGWVVEGEVAMEALSLPSLP